MSKVRFDFEKRISTCKISADYICKSTLDFSGEYYPAADVRELVEAAKKLCFNAQNADQDLWASLPDVIELTAALERIGEVAVCKP